MKTKIGIFAGLFVLVAMIGISPSFADSNTTIISTNNGIQLTKTVVSMTILQITQCHGDSLKVL